MLRKLEYVIPDGYDGKKLLHFLRGYCGFSARLTAKVKYCLLKNGERARTIDPVCAGDKISVSIPDDPRVPEAAEGELDIIYEDEDVLIINKPPRIAVHPTHNHQGDALANIAAAKLLEEGKKAAFRCVGRLDKGASGIVVCALNPFAARGLSEGIEKEYYALVEGELSGRGRIDVPIYRPDPMKTLRACSYEKGGKRAVTNWKAERRFEGATLISLTLETGRTHQIRAHAAYRGHPLAGDSMYGSFMPEIGRPLLHCGKCGFVHPVTGEKKEFYAPLPPDFLSVLKKFGYFE